MYLHMGMTGRISTPEIIPKLESLHANDTFPPPHTHLKLLSNHHEVAFSDPRRFGKVILKHICIEKDEEWNQLAPDALDPLVNYEKLVGQKRGIKAILLDQKAVLCGVGNWVADEVLYQSSLHPNQNLCTNEEILLLKETILTILSTANDCLKAGNDFPSTWLFHVRWSKAISKNQTIKDYKNRPVQFIQSGGRSTAIVSSIQKLKKRNKSTSKGKGKDITKIDSGIHEKNGSIKIKKKQTSKRGTANLKHETKSQSANKKILPKKQKIKEDDLIQSKKVSHDIPSSVRRSKRLRAKS